jgi:ABC-type bacteriocin/lantibiotic exporter with double-glycine peptidase domain
VKRPNPDLIFPGDVVTIPEKKAGLMDYTVPNMQLIPQDKDMSCWFASGQMLIQWRQRTRQMTELAHPDPSLVKKWSKLYDDNPGISNGQIAEFARDLGLVMLPPMTPSPEYMLDLLRRHGPLWINGNSHITVIAGIRSQGAGYEVLVYDPAKPALKQGKWHEFFRHYGLKANTALDASAQSRTSMLHLN